MAKICGGWEERERNTGASLVSSLAGLIPLLWWRLALTLDVVIKHTIKHINAAIRAGIVPGWESREHRRCGWLFPCSGTSLTATKTHFQNEENALQEAQNHQLHAQPWSVPWDELMGVICEQLWDSLPGNKSWLRTDPFQASEYSCVRGKPRWPPHRILFFSSISSVDNSFLFSLILDNPFLLSSTHSLSPSYPQELAKIILPGFFLQLFQILSTLLQQHPSVSHNTAKPAVGTLRNLMGTQPLVK